MPAKGKSASAIKGMLELDHDEVNNSIISENSNEPKADTKRETHVQKQLYISRDIIEEAEIYLIKQKSRTGKHVSFSAFAEAAIREKLKQSI